MIGWGATVVVLAALAGIYAVAMVVLARNRLRRGRPVGPRCWVCHLRDRQFWRYDWCELRGLPVHVRCARRIIRKLEPGGSLTITRIEGLPHVGSFEVSRDGAGSWSMTVTVDGRETLASDADLTLLT